MKTQNEITQQVRDLLAYFPGRGRLALVWLLVLPGIQILFFSMIFGRFAKVGSNGVPYSLFVASGQSILWFYLPTLLALLLRLNHSARSSWSESARIIVSSLVFGSIIGLPALVLNFMWSVGHVGISLSSIVQTLLGVIVAVGSVLLFAIFIGAIAHYVRWLIPLFLFLCNGLIYVIPIAYSLTVVPEKWRTLAAAVPLTPATVVLRNGILNQPFASVTLYWVTGAIQAVVGYLMLFWVLSRITEPGASPNGDLGQRPASCDC